MRERNEIERQNNATRKKKLEEEIIQKEKEAAARILEEERFKQEKEEEERSAQEREQFVQKQKALGLVSFTDRHGKEYWVIPEEIEKIKQKDEEERIKESLLFNVKQAIKEFKPSRQWGNENNYHIELLGHLKRDFPNIRYEVQSGSSRPDLIIGNIAIEIKGPTDNQALNTLSTKILKYSHYYENIVIVLFECNFSERNFNEILSGINRNFPHVFVICK